MVSIARILPILALVAGFQEFDYLGLVSVHEKELRIYLLRPVPRAV